MTEDPGEKLTRECLHPYPLHKAVSTGDTESLVQLLKQGYTPNQADYDGMTALHVACIRRALSCAEILIKYGASVNAMSIDGGTPLCDACASGDVECVKLLMANGADVNPPLVLSTPLHEACLNGSNDGSEECVVILIAAGAQLNANDCHYGTPLHAATLMNSLPCVRRLLRAGASVDKAKIHQTALHVAATNDFYEVGKILLEYGANVYASNNQNKLPIELLPNSDGPFHDLLVKYSSQPRSLQELCRMLIRTEVGPCRLSCLEDMGLPTKIVSYLLYL